MLSNPTSTWRECRSYPSLKIHHSHCTRITTFILGTVLTAAAGCSIALPMAHVQHKGYARMVLAPTEGQA